MVTSHRHAQAGHGLRASMSIAAALSVLGFTSLVWLHNSQPILANTHAATAISDARASAAVSSPATSGPNGPNGVPSAESVFRGAAYMAPEEPIAQF